jgi:hypothetical protein
MVSGKGKLGEASVFVDRERRRRRHPRFRCEFRLTLIHLAASGYETIEGHCRDLSEGGIGLLVAGQLAIGEVVGLNFSLTGPDSPWQLTAVVRHRHGFQYGFEFLNLTEEQRARLKNHLSGRERVE